MSPNAIVFKQIATCTDQNNVDAIYGLTESGLVYFFTGKGWKLLPNEIDSSSSAEQLTKAGKA